MKGEMRGRRGEGREGEETMERRGGGGRGRERKEEGEGGKEGGRRKSSTCRYIQIFHVCVCVWYTASDQNCRREKGKATLHVCVRQLQGTYLYLVTPPGKVSECVNGEPDMGLESQSVHRSRVYTL